MQTSTCNPYRLCFWTTVVLLSAAPAWAWDSSSDANFEAGVELFEKEVRPIFAIHCYSCHGADKQEGALRLDSPTAIRTGGASGNTIVPHEPQMSLLLRAIEYQDEALRMPPPPKPKLDARQVAAVVRWVKLGASMPKPSGTIPPLARVDRQQISKGRDFWSLRPPASGHIPEVPTASWVESPVDAFVLDRIERANLSPNSTADRQTLIRRVTFDLTGLPPTPADVVAFLNDESPDAFSRLLDRLLASPSHGIRWGRHWLDVARYADSNGLDENVAFGNAWRYRDYVVDSFNADKPLDQFLTEQLAGDVMAKRLPQDDSRRPELLIATGYLSLGPKVLAEVDELKMEMDIVDEQIDTVGKSILGLTLGCARCHDHKFDPISMEDYYALAGIFRSTRTMEHFKKVARWHEHPIGTADEVSRKAEFDLQIAQKNKAITEFIAAETAALKSRLKEGETLSEKPETQFEPETRNKLKRLRDELKEFEKSAPDLSSAMGVSEGTIADVPIHVRGSHLTLGKLVTRRFPEVLPFGYENSIAADSSGRLELASWLVDPDHPLTARVLVNRVWRWHFGSGLVRSVDNFGNLGERPSHPELLDYLARRFAAQGWSLKRLHRDLVLSHTYQLSSDENSSSAEIDPDNRLRARSDIRRLEAEAIRDSLLFVSDSLDCSMGGSLLHIKNRQYFFDHTSLDKTNYDSRRRSIYLPVVRNNLYDVFQLFDYADAAVLNGSRESTVVAPQALFMMNSELVLECARRVAISSMNHATISSDPVDDRVRELYLRVLGRIPDRIEVLRAKEQLGRLSAISAGSATPQVWSWFAQSLLASNEFLYIR